MRIVTYNTHGSVGMDRRRDTGRIADVVRALSPDVVCFQELHQRLPWSGGEDHPRMLERLLGRRMVFQRCLRLGFGGFGNAIATRGEVVAVKEHLLPSVKEQRGALEVRVSGLPGVRRVTVVCTHWGLSEAERMRQAESLTAIVRSARPPVVLCGDFNEGPDGAAVRALLSASGLRDADAAANRATFPSDLENVRIDFVLVSPEIEVSAVEVVQTLASDHLPVVADVQAPARTISW